ncbi:hypothetical protein ACFYY1_29245 [Streptomyces sp. NPDC001890]|uniref:hypothetical protein n=1 Tax=Streptomyces sp. NPDC001890 TaxID=3364620 RepID=UPI0036A124AF
MDTTNRLRTVRLGFLWRFSGVGPGCLLGLLSAVVLGASGAVDRLGVGPSLLIAAAVVPVVALPAPSSFWVRADGEGLTLSRALLRRRYRWHDIAGLDMAFGGDPDSDAPRLTLRLRLTTTPATGRGPLVGVLGLAAGHRLRGTEPRLLADLFTLLAAHGVPLAEPDFADRVRAAHGLPPLAPGPGPVEGR